MDPRRGEKHARRVCALPSTCGLRASGLGPNKATDTLSLSIVSRVSSSFLKVAHSMQATAAHVLGHLLLAAAPYSPECVEG